MVQKSVLRCQLRPLGSHTVPQRLVQSEDMDQGEKIPQHAGWQGQWGWEGCVTARGMAEAAGMGGLYHGTQDGRGSGKTDQDGNRG